MKITAIRESVVPISSEISNAYISFAEMTVSAVAVHSDVLIRGQRMIGFGFNSNGRYAPAGILRDRLIPRLLKADPKDLLTDAGDNVDPSKARQVMMANEKPGGHGERSVAVAVLDMALWDLAAKIANKPLYRLLADRYRGGQADSKVHVYAAGGYYYPGKQVNGLEDEMRGYLNMGYTTLKMKIGGDPLADDLKRIEAVLKLLPPGGQLAVDANGRFDIDTAVEYAKALEPYDLKWYEEPGDPLDFELNREVAQVSATPIATGENLFSMQEARNLIRYGGLIPARDYLQFDPALSYGLVEYLRTIEMVEEAGWARTRCVPHGGHQFALHMSAGLGLGGNESYPGIFEPFGGFADGVPVQNGEVRIPDAPGIGIETKVELMRVYAKLM